MKLKECHNVKKSSNIKHAFHNIDISTFSLGQIVGTSFSADRVIVRPDNTIFADGNVVIRQGAIFIGPSLLLSIKRPVKYIFQK